jgi:cobalt-zinc-cadmium efflux system membrane fusion protein
VSTSATGDRAEGRIIFIGPVMNSESRSARVVARLENPEETWRPGSFVSAEIVVAADQVQAMVTASAILKIGGHPTVFVKSDSGYQSRQVVVGRSDARMVEITSGLSPGETVAVVNAFILKAELLKVQAED